MTPTAHISLQTETSLGQHFLHDSEHVYTKAATHVSHIVHMQTFHSRAACERRAVNGCRGLIVEEL